MNLPANVISIWSPREHDRKVLIAKYKVGARNEITFTKAKRLLGKKFYMTGAEIQKYPVESNGSIPVYAVSLDDLLEHQAV